MEWSISKLSDLRQCHRKFYFAHELANFNCTHPLRRKAYELKHSKSILMWQGDLVDNFFSRKIIPIYLNKKVPDFTALADEIVDIAKGQFEFSRRLLYKDNLFSKSASGDAYQILDIHESGVKYKDEDILNVYSTIKSIILKIPFYPSPEKGKSLHEYLSSSYHLLSDIKYWKYEFEGIKVKPQIDLVRFRKKSIHVIDWKVSDSFTSDYSKQLYLAGIIAFHNIKKFNDKRKWDLPRLNDVSLFEVNLMNGNSKEHSFTRTTTAEALAYIFQFRDEQEQLSENKNWNELNIEDYITTDENTTCASCMFKPLCVHLIKNKFTYDENEYYKLVSDK